MVNSSCSALSIPHCTACSIISIVSAGIAALTQPITISSVKLSQLTKDSIEDVSKNSFPKH